MKEFIKRHRHAWLILTYLPIYMLWFLILENTVTKDYYIIRSPLDSYIPFVEWFIIPYLLWFPFIAGFVLYFILKDKTEYYRLCGLLMSGMTVFLLVCTFFPNGLDLRPDLSTLGRENIFLDIIRILHKADTATNVCPSIHVYNSLAVCLAVFTSEHFKTRRVIKTGTLVLTVFICMSTVFLKQHSIIDVFCSFLLAAVLSPVFYLRRSPKTTDAVSKEDAENVFN